MVKIIMLNGPKEVGKTAIAENIALRREDTVVVPMMDGVKLHAIRHFTNYTDRAKAIVSQIEEKGLKDEPFEDTGKTPREMYTAYARALRSSDINAVSKLWKDHVQYVLKERRKLRLPVNYVIVSDLRFAHEVKFMEYMYFSSQCKLVHVTRADKDFFGDVGHYVEKQHCELYTVHNDTTVEAAATTVVRKVMN